ncbi:MAG: helix-hairpin-helix domain-containing protein [Lachnospiraceae bacterium]|nr:helix-hairpin-helix domain-containing protein [Lachnospiraceae bacterium]
MKINTNLKRRVIEIAVIVVISCILFLACNRISNNKKVIISGVNEESSLSRTITDESGEEKSDFKPDEKTKVNSEQNEEQAEVYIYVCGEVKEPGLYALPAGSRAMDAVLAAGGFGPDAATDAINLAQIETDGSMLRIPSVQEVLEGKYEIPSCSDTPSGDNKKINLNTAGLSELCNIPGIGEAKASAVIEYRKQNGNFSCTDDLMKVPGIKEGTYEKIKDYVTVN